VKGAAADAIRRAAAALQGDFVLMVMESCGLPPEKVAPKNRRPFGAVELRHDDDVDARFPDMLPQAAIERTRGQ
jgi:hypothetical protein